MADNKNFVNTNNKRGDRYDDVIKDIAEQKVCPFCPENLSKYHKNPILLDGQFWVGTDNMYPYKPVKNHVIFIHKTHIENLTEITPEAWVELKKFVDSIVADRKISGGSIMLRFGDTTFTGASVNHLHAHLIQSDPQNPDYNQSGLQVRLG